MCLSPEQRDISCSFRGENEDVIVTLNGLLLMQTRDQRQNLNSALTNITSLMWTKHQENEHNVTTVTIGLNGQLTGNLMCRVWDENSRMETVIHLDSCTGKVVNNERKIY